MLPPVLYRLRKAAELLGGGITERALRAEISAGRLAVTKLSGKFYVTPQALSDMVAAATIPARPSCPVADSQPGSVCDQPEATAEPPGSFSTDRVSLAQAQAQAQMTVRQLRRPSRPTSPRATGPQVVRIGRNNSSSPR
jgi:hypothetical protein